MELIMFKIWSFIFAFFMTAGVWAQPLKEGKVIHIDEETSFSYTFVDRPKVGDIILKVSVNNQKARPIQVFATYDMPTMRGRHASGKIEFKRNRAGDYVLPIHFAMPGAWEIILDFEESQRPLYQTVITLEI